VIATAIAHFVMSRSEVRGIRLCEREVGELGFFHGSRGMQRAMRTCRMPRRLLRVSASLDTCLDAGAAVDWPCGDRLFSNRLRSQDREAAW
jgi:hypothetical protein